MNRPATLALGVAALLLAGPAASGAVVSAPRAATQHPGAAAAGARPGCADSFRNLGGGSWSTGSNWSSGQPPAAGQAACIVLPLRAPVVLYGTAAAASLLLGAGDRLLLQGAKLTLADGPSSVAGSLFGTGLLVLGAGATLVNTGTIVVFPGENLTISGAVVNRPSGTIAVAGDSPYGATLYLDAASLDNDGTIETGALSSSLTANTGTILDNNAGTIANAGTFTVGAGATFVEDTGATTGNPLLVQGGSLRLQGGGVSSFALLANLSHDTTLSGEVAAGQIVEIEGNSLSPIRAAASFTNDGTIIGNGYLALPVGGTLTNEGAIEDGHGSAGSAGLSLEGSLTNGRRGTLGESNGSIVLDRRGTTLSNAGTAYMLLPNLFLLNAADSQSPRPRNITMTNTGSLYVGVGGDAAWGGYGIASSIQAYPGDHVVLGGTIVPVPAVEPVKGIYPGDQVFYDMTGGHLTGNVPQWTLACGARVAEHWTLSCTNTARLYETKTTTLEPTEVTLAGSGTPDGSAGWTSPYGEPVTLSATVSAQNGSMPTGTVTFFASEQNSASPAALRPDLLGTAQLRAGGRTGAVATLTTRALPPGTFMLLALYGGDHSHLAASTIYGQPAPSNVPHTYGNEIVTAQPTTLALHLARTGATAASPLRLRATLQHAPVGGRPSGLVVFFDNGVPIGTAPLVNAGASTTAQLSTTLPAGNASIMASYSGDYDFAGASSPSVAVAVGT